MVRLMVVLLSFVMAVVATLVFVVGYLAVLNLGAQTAEKLGLNQTQYWELVNEWGHGLDWLVGATAVLLFIYVFVLALISFTLYSLAKQCCRPMFSRVDKC